MPMQGPIRHAIPLLSTLALAVACATASTTSQRSPDASPTRYPRVLVAVAGVNLKLRQEAELSFFRAGYKAGFEVVPYHAIFLPGRVYAQSELQETLQKQRIAAVLIVTDQTTDPPAVVGSASVIPLPNGQTRIVSSSRMEQNEFTVASEMWDVSSKKLVWISSTHLRRNRAAESNFLGALAKDVVRALVRDGVVQASQP